MKIVHIGVYNPHPTGGVGKTILEQTKALHAMGLNIEIWHFTYAVCEPTQVACNAPFPVWQLPMQNNSLLRCVSFNRMAKKWINLRLAEIQVFHIHSVFIPENVLLSKLGIPYILTPNGGWSDVVLHGRRKWIKRLWLIMKEMRMWKSAAAIQAVCREEANQLAKHRGMAQVEIIPNGTDIPRRISALDERDCFLFLGRLDPYQKGLDVLFDALKIAKQMNARLPKLIVAGPDYRGGRAYLEAFRDRHQLSEMVKILGVVQGFEKESLFLQARIFIHTSRYEGLPLVLLEALSYGIPCLLTPGTNVATEWHEAGCAFQTPLDPAAIAEELIRISNLSLIKESEAALSLAKSEYSWSEIATKLSRLYQLASPI
jgi:glycosyltransferase involved in cell wall biosynthesis